MQSPADGYTFAVVFDTHAVNPSLIPGLPYDTARDLAAVALVGTGAMVIATHADAPFRSFADVIAAVLKQPDFAARLASQGIDVRTGPPQAAQAFIEGQIDIWARVVKENGIKSE